MLSMYQCAVTGAIVQTPLRLKARRFRHSATMPGTNAGASLARPDAAARFVRLLRLFHNATSFGGVENLVLLGPSSVGKTHLAVALGLKAIEHRYRVLFTTAAAMFSTLTKALSESRFDDKLKVYTIPRLLIIDEIGYLPVDRQAATLFFQLISRRYERGPMILTSNQSFGSWGDVFGERVIASTILDRILHHATTISIRGDSYRLKDKLKSGVVKPTMAGT